MDLLYTTQSPPARRLTERIIWLRLVDVYLKNIIEGRLICKTARPQNRSGSFHEIKQSVIALTIACSYQRFLLFKTRPPCFALTIAYWRWTANFIGKPSVLNYCPHTDYTIWGNPEIISRNNFGRPLVCCGYHIHFKFMAVQPHD